MPHTKTASNHWIRLNPRNKMFDRGLKPNSQKKSFHTQVTRATDHLAYHGQRTPPLSLVLCIKTAKNQQRVCGFNRQIQKEIILGLDSPTMEHAKSSTQRQQWWSLDMLQIKVSIRLVSMRAAVLRVGLPRPSASLPFTYSSRLKQPDCERTALMLPAVLKEQW